MANTDHKIIDASAKGKKTLDSGHKAKKPAQAAEYSGSEPVPVRIAFLGGINEVGKNMTLYEYKGDMFLVDCGLAFPDQDMLGVDIVLPDFTFIERNIESIRGLIVTHGHEDHIGWGIAYLLKLVSLPIYGTELTLGLIKGKLREHGLLNEADLRVVKPGSIIELGSFTAELIHVNHSIPDAVSLAIRCEVGVIIHTGDFKIDSTPIDGGMIDLAAFARISAEGVLCMLSDSTNAERPGYTVTESRVGDAFDSIFRKVEGKRLIVATFASNIHRVQQIMDVAHSLSKKVALSGRSLENVVSIGAELGYLKIPEGLMIELSEVNDYPQSELVIITTGSQGEPLSALSRMSMSEHRNIEVGPGDCVVISATPIPGNEKTVSKVINELMKLGAEVVYEKMYDVHVSGHACQEELKMMLGIVKPKYFIPVHGEQKHLRKHALLAQSMGIPDENVVIVDNGYVAEITSQNIRIGGKVPAGRVFVDGYGIGDVGSAVLKDRKRLSQDGLLVVSITVDRKRMKILAGPEIDSRGFVYVKEAEKLMEDAKALSQDIISASLKNGSADWATVKPRLRDEMSRLLYERTKRSPMIIPVILEYGKLLNP